jgi:molybdopterin converting factor small subunit
LKINLRFYGVVYDITGIREWSTELNEGAKIHDLLNNVAIAFPELKELIYLRDELLKNYLEVSLNNEDIMGLNGFDSDLRDRDTVFLMPPIGGG